MLSRLLDYAVPDLCLACHTQQAHDPLKLCWHCRSRLASLDRERCRICLRQLAVSAPLCGDCLAAESAWKGVFSLWEYRAPGDAIVHGLKFSRLRGLGERLAHALWERYAEELAEAEVVVPIPIPWTRRLKRGFNHAQAIAAPLAARLGRPCQELLQRRPSTALSLTPRQDRLRRVRRTLRAAPNHRLEQRTVLLVDDVVTTGATLRVASELLARRGARHIIAAIPFATPPIVHAR